MNEKRSVTALLALTPAVPWLGALPAGRWVVPLVAPLTLFFAFAPAVRARRYGRAWVLGMIWASLLSIGVIAFVVAAPRAASLGILHGDAYRSEMFGWIETGVAKENDWRQFLPEHALHLGAFLVLSLASGGFLGLVLGAFLVDYMSYFVASFGVAAASPVSATLLAWVPWSVVRVAAFVLLGSLAARPVLARGDPPFEGTEARWMALASAGLLLDVLLKAMLAPAYGLFLRSLLAAAR